MLKILLFLAISTELIQAQSVHYHWKYLNFTWPSSAAYNAALEDGAYIPENTIITGIKIWKDRLYLTLPRWKRGVPATLASTSAKPTNGETSPLLEPYPSWDMQRLDNCSAFQYVQSMEIDPKGRMWVLENGRTEFKTDKPRTKCPTRLVVLDLEKNGEVLMDYTFPRHVARIKSVFTNDIVLDHEDGGWAYITDTDSKFPGIIVFSLRERRSWKVTHESMKADKEACTFLVNGTMFETVGPVDGIALSPVSTEGNRILYYTPLSSFEIFAVPVKVLKARKLGSIEGHVKLIGRKSSQTDGMMMSAAGSLYYGLLTEDSVGLWPTRDPSSFAESQRLLTRNAEVNQWPDTFALDGDGQLWWTSNRIQRFMGDKVDLGEANYHVIGMETRARCYQYYEDGSAPEWPEID